MTRSIASTLCLLTVALGPAFASPASAFDLGGHWSGTYKCKGTQGGEKDSYTDTLEADFTQNATAVGANVSFTGTPYNYAGLAVANAKKPDKGDLMLAICGTDSNLLSGIFDELARLAVTTKPSKSTGSLSGFSVYSSPPSDIYTCKWKLKRTSPNGPTVPTACP